VLIRAVEPLAGIEKMQQLRHHTHRKNLASGPGKLCMAFGLDKRHNGLDLCQSELCIVEGESPAESEILATPRIGISAGKEFPWRFCLKHSDFVTKTRGSAKIFK
jgi:DNA-3-methyladenine glycosylase